MSTGVDWLLHLITVLVGTVSQMSTGVDYVDEQRNSQKDSVDTVSVMSTEVDQRVWFIFCWNCNENIY